MAKKENSVKLKGMRCIYFPRHEMHKKLCNISKTRSLLQEHKDNREMPFTAHHGPLPLRLYWWEKESTILRISYKGVKLKLGYGVMSSSLGLGQLKII